MEVRGPAGGVGVLGERAAVKRAEGGRCAGAGTALRRRRDSATPPTGRATGAPARVSLTLRPAQVSRFKVLVQERPGPREP